MLEIWLTRTLLLSTAHVLVQRALLSVVLAQLRPPTELARQPRPLEESAFWKGTECRVRFKSWVGLFLDEFVLGAHVFAVDTTYKSVLFAQSIKNLPRSRSMLRTSSSTGCRMSFAGLCRKKSSCCSLCSALPCGCSEATR